MQNGILLSIKNSCNAQAYFRSLLRLNSARQSKSLHEQFSSWHLPFQRGNLKMLEYHAVTNASPTEFYKGYPLSAVSLYSVSRNSLGEHLVYLIRWCTRYIRKFFRKRHRQMRGAFFKTGRSVILLRDSTTNNAGPTDRCCIIQEKYNIYNTVYILIPRSVSRIYNGVVMYVTYSSFSWKLNNTKKTSSIQISFSLIGNIHTQFPFQRPEKLKIIHLLNL